MKTQLLQDIDENGSKTGPPPPPALPAAPPDGGGSLIERAARAPRPGVAASAPAVAPAVAPAPESINESAATPPARPPAAVWRRRQPATSAGPVQGGTGGASMQRAAVATPQREFDPRYGAARVPPPRPRAPDPVPPPPVPPAPVVEPASEIPEWLGERLREDARREERAEWSSLWKRRAVTWSMAAGLLAIVAAGALWVYEDSRVDGALGVVAQTTPEHPAPVPARVMTPAPVVEAPPAAPASAPVSAPASAPVAVPAPAPTPAPVEPPAAPSSTTDAALPAVAGGGVGALAAVAGAARTQTEPPRTAVEETPAARAAPRSRPQAAARRTAPRRQLAQADKPRRAAAVPAPVPAEPTERQRREETLMQCRAHGYDQRQCDRRGCLMTPYGFACKG